MVAIKGKEYGGDHPSVVMYGVKYLAVLYCHLVSLNKLINVLLIFAFMPTLIVKKKHEKTGN